jgi:hypothetical protein
VQLNGGALVHNPGPRIGWRLILAAVACVAGLATPLPGSAARPAPPPPDDEAYYEAITDRILEMQVRGASDERIDRMLSRAFGWELVAGNSSREPGATLVASENSDVSLSVPRVYFNTVMGRYEVSATFRWEDCTNWWNGSTEPCYMGDYNGTNMGGYDGFGIRVSREVSRRAQSFVVATTANCRQWYANPADADGWGVVYRNQDRFKDSCGTSNYNWHRGAIVYSFMTLPGCPKGQYQFSTKMAHTWSSTGVSGISVSNRGISVSFSSTEHQWTAVSNPKTWYPCGT